MLSVLAVAGLKKSGTDMNESTYSPRVRLLRDAVTLQLKLLADGFRDAMLIPVSLIAAVIGFARGGEEPDREFRQVIKLGLRSERWINLFGQQKPLGKSHPGDTIDSVLEQAETVMIKQYRKGRSGASDSPEGEDKTQNQD